MSKAKRNKEISRRGFIGGAGAALAAATAPLIPAQSTKNGAADVPRSTIRLTINGKPQLIEVEDRWTLAEALRDHLNLIGTKIGCDRRRMRRMHGAARSQAVYSCSHLAAWMDGKSIQTVEGLETNGKLDPLQKSFMEHDAPQCGYCTSGQLMSARVCLNQHPHATAEEVRAAITGNICRCSNYNRYVEATLAVAGTSDITRNVAKIVLVDAAGEKPLKTLNNVGHATTRIDARQRVTGKATYTRDVILRGMLYASVLRSPHPHARIRSVDTSKALAMPGVKTIVTHENCQFV